MTSLNNTVNEYINKNTNQLNSASIDTKEHMKFKSSSSSQDDYNKVPDSVPDVDCLMTINPDSTDGLITGNSVLVYENKNTKDVKPDIQDCSNIKCISNKNICSTNDKISFENQHLILNDNNTRPMNNVKQPETRTRYFSRSKPFYLQIILIKLTMKKASKNVSQKRRKRR